jgi:hypothetical protein
MCDGIFWEEKIGIQIGDNIVWIGLFSLVADMDTSIFNIFLFLLSILVIFDSLFGNPDIPTQPVKLISLPLIE